MLRPVAYLRRCGTCISRCHFSFSLLKSWCSLGRRLGQESSSLHEIELSIVKSKKGGSDIDDSLPRADLGIVETEPSFFDDLNATLAAFSKETA